MTGFKQACTADDILYGRVHPGRRIVVVGGGSVGCETADYLAPLVNDLAKTNRRITLLEMGDVLAANESGAGRAVLITRMLSKGVEAVTGAKVTRVDEGTVTYEKDVAEHVIADADTLVLALGYRANASLVEALEAAGITVHAIGDAKAPGNIRDAVAAAYALAREL